MRPRLPCRSPSGAASLAGGCFAASARRRWFSLIPGVALFAALCVATLATNTLLTAGRSLYPAQQIMIHDLVAISVQSQRSWIPASLESLTGPATAENLGCVY